MAYRKIVIIFALYQHSALSHDFDLSLLQGNVDLSILSHESKFLPKGVNDDKIVVDLYLNDKLVMKNAAIRSTFNSNSSKHEPCLIESQLKMISLDNPVHSLPCYFVSDIAPSSTWDYDSSRFKLKYTVPQSLLNKPKRGETDPATWDEGITALFVKHNSNYYITNYSGVDTSHYITSNLKTGLNFGLWQFRHDGFFRRNNNESKYNVINSYLQRPIASINSSATIGESNTSEGLFSSLAFTGLKLETDKRMWPQSQLGYAPEVRGQALTNAHVSVIQNGQVIREVTVPPGPFLIDDLNDTRSNGDLQVVIRETDGAVSTFTVPYSSVPLSIRPGNSDYGIVLGDVRGFDSTESWFGQGTLQTGVSNRVTINSGFRVGNRYHSYLTGGVVATPIGAFGLKGIYAFTQIHDNESTTNGWQLESSYGRSFVTGTHFSLLAYRHSSEDYMSLEDVLSKRVLRKDYDLANTREYLNQRNRFTLSVSQTLPSYGTLNLSGTLVDYYNADGTSINYQAAYNNSWRNVSYNVSLGRQYSLNIGGTATHEDTLSIGFSIPLDLFNRGSTVGFNYATSSYGDSATTNVTGTIGDKSKVAYSAYAGLENGDNTYGANVSTRTRVGSFSLGSVSGNGYTRISTGMSGTIVVHRDGITLGPYANESFALVQAEGGSGLEVLNGQGAKIDANGYAIQPSLMSYRPSSVSLGASADTFKTVELKTGSKHVTPYAGAISKVTFETVTGAAVLITTLFDEGEYPPIGATVYNENGEAVGMVGQGGQVYVRLMKGTNKIFVRWGINQECGIGIDEHIFNNNKPLHSFTSVCEVAQ